VIDSRRARRQGRSTAEIARLLSRILKQLGVRPTAATPQPLALESYLDAHPEAQAASGPRDAAEVSGAHPASPLARDGPP
jgi:hypothetical protein